MHVSPILSLCFLRGLEVGTEEALIKMDKFVSETGRLCLCKKTGRFPFEGMMDGEERWGGRVF